MQNQVQVSVLVFLQPSPFKNPPKKREGKDGVADTEVNDSTCGIKGPFKDKQSVKDAAYEYFENVQSFEQKLVLCIAKPFWLSFFETRDSIAKKLSIVYKMDLQHYKMLQKAIGINADSFLAAANPTHDKDGKRRFLVIERFFPNGERGTYIAALGGHSLPVISPPDHYQF